MSNSTIQNILVCEWCVNRGETKNQYRNSGGVEMKGHFKEDKTMTTTFSFVLAAL